MTKIKEQANSKVAQTDIFTGYLQAVHFCPPFFGYIYNHPLKAKIRRNAASMCAKPNGGLRAPSAH